MLLADDLLSMEAAWFSGTSNISMRGKPLPVFVRDNHHLEFAGENLISPTEVEGSICGGIRWDF